MGTGRCHHLGRIGANALGDGRLAARFGLRLDCEWIPDLVRRYGLQVPVPR
jgi:hypothetical protein